MLYKLCCILGGIQCSWASERIANKEIKLMSEICEILPSACPNSMSLMKDAMELAFQWLGIMKHHVWCIMFLK